ncbi:flagellar basal body-associated FliL family protein [Dongia rigui]|uniref:Flagellar protein FliL n=1 Tax=Dongia rigui TaxID=940149 RepID=A0ABU5DU95_9PROT|nr:flagellar basal body-associated FliL family protein [Dongia rigui]MDY0870530.1 flagellar basal body-associated FliL family protein [Dongia rigui]
MAEEGAEGAPQKKKMSGKKLVLFIVLPLLLLGGGGAAAYFLLFKEDPKKAEAGHEGEADAAAAEEEAAAEDEAHPPVFIELPKMQANLIMTGKKQPFMVTTLVLEVGSPEEQKLVEELQPRIENEIVTYLRSLRPEDIQGAAGLQRLREELLLRVKAAAKPAKVKDILFKEMLVQQ